MAVLIHAAEKCYGQRFGFLTAIQILSGRFYLEYLFKTKKIASKLRLDKGTETGVMATMHAFLRQAPR